MWSSPLFTSGTALSQSSVQPRVQNAAREDALSRPPGDAAARVGPSGAPPGPRHCCPRAGPGLPSGPRFRKDRHPHHTGTHLGSRTEKTDQDAANTRLFYKDGSWDSPLIQTDPFLSEKKKWVVRGSLQGSGRRRRAGVRSRVRPPAPGPGAGGLDVQRGLLAREQPEHGSRHGLHVDLQREG